MQFWIYFRPGSGGDGFANLLEQSRNIQPFDLADTGQKSWRLHRFVDNQPKFYAPDVDSRGCFRKLRIPFSTSNNKLNKWYVDCVNQKINTVCTSHDLTLELLEKSECTDIFLNGQIKILLDYTDEHRVGRQFTIKNLEPGPVDIAFVNMNEILDLKKFDYVLNIEQLQTDWQYTKNFCKELNIDLNENEYQDYQSILNGSTKFDHSGIPRYQSSIVDGCFSYKKIN